MTSKRFTPIFLAATLLLTGATGAFLGAVAPANAITSVDELSDVNPDFWAYEALRDLVEKYDVIEGYPDHTFRGNKAPTRWEMAAALNALLKSVGRDLARLGAEKADKKDLQTLARLQEQFRNELTALQARTSALESRASAIEAKNEEQDNRLTLLEKTQLHGDFSVGFLGDMSSQGTRDSDADRNGILDGITSIGRLRLTMDVPIREDKEDSVFGRGDIHARLVAAMGRNNASGGAETNLGAFGTYAGYSRIAADTSAGNEGINGNALATGGNTRANLYVENVHYKQHLNPGIPLLTDLFPGMDVMPDDGNWETSGDFYLGVVPWRYLFDQSPYRGNEVTQFQNPMFVNTLAAVNYNQPTIAYAWHQELGADDLSMDFTTALASPDTGDFYDNMNLTYEARLNYTTSFLGEDYSKPGSVYVGGYHIWETGNTANIDRLLSAGGATAVNRSGTPLDFNGDTSGSTSALYMGWNQEWYKGIGTALNYLYTNNGSTNLLMSSINQSLGINTATTTVQATGATGGRILVGIQQSLGAMLHVPMSAVVPGWRDNDTMGVGFGFVDFHNVQNLESRPVATKFQDAWEKNLEVYYKWQATEAISVVPSLQLIFDSLGIKENGTKAVLGLRTNYTF